MKSLFDYHLKQKTLAVINWHSLFLNWHKSQTNIIEFYSSLEDIYPPNYQFSNRKIGAWHAMLCVSGCYDITPWTSKESKVKFKPLKINKN